MRAFVVGHRCDYVCVRMFILDLISKTFNW